MSNCIICETNPADELHVTIMWAGQVGVPCRDCADQAADAIAELDEINVETVTGLLNERRAYVRQLRKQRFVLRTQVLSVTLDLEDDIAAAELVCENTAIALATEQSLLEASIVEASRLSLL